MRHNSSDVLSVTSESVASRRVKRRARASPLQIARALYLFTRSLFFLFYHSTKQRHCTRCSTSNNREDMRSDIQHKNKILLGINNEIIVTENPNLYSNY